MLKIAIIAGEPSGDMLAASLIKELKSQSLEPIEFTGIGGVAMAKEGFASAFDMDVLSVGGYGLDVIGAIPKIYLLYRKICQRIVQFQPDVFIGVDAPDFNFHVEKKLKQYGIKTVHYISPTIWAWRYERIFKIKKTTDLMLCIFPMEEPLYRAENIKAKFIGHPLADQIELDIDTALYKKKFGLDGTAIVFTILAGSRKSELKNLAKLFIETCSLIAKEVPSATFLFPVISNSAYTMLEEQFRQLKVNFKYQLLSNQTGNAIKASDLVLAKSGTVTLEVALSKKPLIISYKVSKFTEWLLKKKLMIKYVGQPNILLNDEVAKEFLQSEAIPSNLAKYFIALYHDKARQKQMIEKFYELHHSLRRNASYEGAKSILELIQKS